MEFWVNAMMTSCHYSRAQIIGILSAAQTYYFKHKQGQMCPAFMSIYLSQIHTMNQVDTQLSINSCLTERFPGLLNYVTHQQLNGLQGMH